MVSGALQPTTLWKIADWKIFFPVQDNTLQVFIGAFSFFLCVLGHHSVRISQKIHDLDE